MKVEQIYTGCLAEAAYYIESKGEAVVIDPLREVTPYLERAQASGAKIKYVLETHFHADFVSGHLDLAKKTGATIVYGPTAKPDFEIHVAKDEEILKVGDVTIEVLHTPGHTLESTTYLLRNEKGKDYAIFTGDTLFLGDVGRPDLAVKQGELTKEDLAGMLYNSLKTKILPLADEVIIYPGHGAGSACGKHLSTETWGYLGEEKKTNYALRPDMSKAEFVKEVTAGLTPPPQYFPKNAMMNKLGYQSFDEVLERGGLALNPAEFTAIQEEKDALILDVRTQQEFAKAHIPGSIFIGLDGDFAPWVGALITDIQQPILLITPAGREKETVTRLARVGYDFTLGFLKGGVDAWKNAGNKTASIQSISPEKYTKKWKAGRVGQTLDVRKPTEFLTQHLLNATNFPLDYLNQNMSKLNRYDTYHLYCAGGYRSIITASILKARGYDNLVNINNGWQEIEKTDLPKTDYACPTTIEQEVIDRAVAAVL